MDMEYRDYYKENNKWFFSFYAQSKEDANVVIPHAYITFRYGGTTWAAYPLKGTNVLLIFLPIL